jgi:hypothetical protein
MRRLVTSLCATALALGSGLVSGAFADNPVSPVDGGTAVDQCYAQGSSSIDDPGYRFSRSVQALVSGAAAACRAPLRAAPDATLPEYCGAFDGREVSESKVAAYELSWVHRALTLQRGLDSAAPLWEAQMPHTHNSFNASAYAVPADGSLPSYYPTLTNQDPNQVYSMTDQLRMDVRAIEIDLHWMPSPYGTAATHGYWPTMCHGDGQNPTGTGLWVHVGCTDDRPMQDGLAEVRRWLAANPHQFVLLYLENQLFPGGPVASQQLAHDTAAGIIHDELGSMVYRPPAGLAAGACAPMPYDETQAQMLAAGKQVLLVGNCGPGSGWNSWVFSRGPSWDESGSPTSYGAADCAKDEAAREQHTSFRRFFESSPWLEAMTGATTTLSASTTAQMVRCGVNIVGFDQLQPFDGRLAAFVWSWAADQPASTGGSCALRGADSRFVVAPCSQRHRFACVDAHLDWHATTAVGQWQRGPAVCDVEFPGSHFGVPPNGYRNAQLGSADVWLDYRKLGQQWQPNAVVGAHPHTG